MDEQDRLAERFETQRGRLRAVAYRLLGSFGEAEDAVQEAWLRLSRTDVSEVENLPGWLTTVVSRLCLDVLRARRSHPELLSEELWDAVDGSDPAQEAVLVDSVGRALLVVLDTLAPAERIAFVLHDTFAVPFDRIAPIVGRTPVTTKKLASRARRKIHGTPTLPRAELAHHRQVVDAFLTAARGGDLDALLAVLAPDVVRRADPAALPPGLPTEVHGARAVADETTLLSRRSHFATPALVNGKVGLLVAPRGRLRLALTFTIRADRITAYEVIATPPRLRRLTLAILPAQN